MLRYPATLLLLSAILTAACTKGPPAGGGLPNILLIVMDAARADHLSCYGYHRQTTPNLDRVAAGGLRFTRAVSSTSWTLPSHASLFTGLLPNEHGAHHQHMWLADHIPTLAELLKARGYRTAAFSDNPFVDSAQNLDRGFDIFEAVWADSAVAEPHKHHSSAYTNRLVREFTSEHKQEQAPFFVFINYMEPHAPYDPPEPYRSRYLDPGEEVPELADSANWNQKLVQEGTLELAGSDFDALRDVYDGALSYLDSLIGELLGSLEESGLYDNTLVIIISDHGELFGEWGHLGHDKMLYRPLVQILIILRHPGLIRKPGVRGEQVAIADIFHTLVDLLDLEGAAPTGAPFCSLLDERINGHTCYSLKKTHPWDDNEAMHWHLNDCRALWTTDDRQYIMFEDESYECYDLARDFEEREDLYPDSVTKEEVAQRIKEFEALLVEFEETGRDLLVNREKYINPENEKTLRALGYLGDKVNRQSVPDSVSEHPHVMQHMYRGFFFGRRDSLDEAERELRTAMGMSPENPFIRRGLGVVLAKNRKHLEAARLFRSIIGQLGDEQETDLRLLLAESLCAAGKKEEALGHLRQALALPVKKPETVYYAVNQLLASGDSLTAELFLKRMLKEYPGQLTEIRRMTGQHILEKNWDLACLLLRVEIAHEPTPQAYLMLSQVQVFLGRKDEARRSLEQVLGMDIPPQVRAEVEKKLERP
ncbi:MAG: sulfatase-like hydrolase/transferase [Candidatus Glassbacteria bacterium]|nr:sulfatase-like hydrolase/transferase [Candidatus Glassbacteria bacterium]